MMRVGIQADNHRVGEKAGNFVVGPVGAENLVVDSVEIILTEPANRLGRVHDGGADMRFAEVNQRPIPLLHLNDAILDGHAFPLA